LPNASYVYLPAVGSAALKDDFPVNYRDLIKGGRTMSHSHTPSYRKHKGSGQAFAGQALAILFGSAPPEVSRDSPSVFVDQNVARFEVAVDQTMVMHRFQAVGHLVDQAYHLNRIAVRVFLFQPLSQRESFHGSRGPQHGNPKHQERNGH